MASCPSTFTSGFVSKNSTSTVKNNISKYQIRQGEQYEVIFTSTTSFNYLGYAAFSSATNTHIYQVGDVINITQGGAALNPQYNGTHTVNYVPNTKTFAIDVDYGVADLTISATSTYNDSRATEFPLYSSSTIYAFNGAIKHNDYINYAASSYTMLTSSSNAKFLSNIPSGYTFDLNNRAYLNFFTTQTPTGSTKNLVIQRNDGAIFKIANTGTTVGGQMVGVGPYNLNNATLSSGSQPVLSSSANSYSVWLESSASTRISEVKTFSLYENCSANKYTQYQLLFVDRLGSWISFNFDLASKKKLDINRKEYKQSVGSYNPSTNKWSYSVSDRGRAIYDTTIKESITVNSNYIDSQEVGDYLSELFSSPSVYHIDDNGNILPIIITDSSFVYKFKNTDKLINYTLTFEYANGESVQNN